jgi:hypothetical protein
MSKKLLSVGVVLTLIAAVFVGVASTASAQSMSLCQTVDALVAAGVIAPDKVAAAKAAAGCGSTTSSACYSFTKDLTVGSTGADVSALQAKLSVSQATGYFGAITKAAVQAYQTSKGISATGYVGPLTRAALNACVVTTTTTTTTTTNTSSNSSLSGGDGDFQDFDVLGNPDSTDIDEGETDDVLGFEFDADGSDLKIERVDVLFAEMGSDTDKPWKVLETVELKIDGKIVAEVDASDADVWSEEENDEYSVRFDDVDIIVKEGKTAKAYVVVTVQDDLDTDDEGTWNVEIMDDGIRAVNGAGIQVYEGSSDDDIDSDADERDFTIGEVPAGDLTVSVDDEDNEDIVVEVDENNDTEDEVIYTATLESEEGDNNIEEITVNIATTTGTTNGLSDFVKTLRLFVDGEEVGSETVGDDDGAESIVFEDLDIDVAEDEEVELVVKADFESQENNYATTTTGLFVDGIVVDYVDQSDDDQTVTSTTDGGSVTLSLSALTVTVGSTPSADDSVASDESKGRFFVQFTVKAPKSEDIYIAKGATTSTAVGSGLGAEFVVVDGNGTTVTATTTAANNLLSKVSGSATETSGYWKITKGNSAVLKLDVIVENTGNADARTLGIALTGINYNTSAATANVQFTQGLDEDFRSDTAYLLTSNTQN